MYQIFIKTKATFQNILGNKNIFCPSYSYHIVVPFYREGVIGVVFLHYNM